MPIKKIKKTIWNKDGLLWLSSAIAVVVIFQICYGLQALVPTNIKWLMIVKQDWGQHYLGWFVYRNEPWYFPIGEMRQHFYPLGTNVGFTDSIPLLAILFKPFTKILPEDFQYLGIWLFLCHLLAGYFTVRICKLFKLDPVFIFIAVLLIAANPVLVYRGLHPALCAHWMFLASLYLYLLNPLHTTPKKILGWQLALLLVSGLVNPYICFMVLGFTIATAWKLWMFEKAISWKGFLLYETASLFLLFLVWFLVGLINFKGEDLSVTGAYGLYSLNLNALYNADIFSSILPKFSQVSWHQYEGFMYLGLGMMLLIILLIGYTTLASFGRKGKNKLSLAFPQNRKKLIPLLCLAIVCALFAVTHVISINDQVLFRIPIPDSLKKLGEVFRASARFFWIPYYLILFFTIIAVAKTSIRRIVRLTVLIIAVCIQFYDIKPLMTHWNRAYGGYDPPLDDKSWLALMNQFDEVLFFPPFEAHQLTHMDYQDFCFLTARLRKPINIGYVARSDSRGMQTYSDSLTRIIEEGKLSNRALYITTAPHLNRFALALQTGAARLNTLDGYYYIFSTEISSPALLSLSEALNDKNKAKLDSGMNAVAKRKGFTETEKIKPASDKNITYYIQRLNVSETYISTDGFAFISSTENNKGDSIFITLSNDDKAFISPSRILPRPDITEHFKKPYLENAGFQALSFFTGIPAGKYFLGITIKNSKGEFYYQPTDNIVRVGVPEYAVARSIETLPDPGPIVFGLNEDIKTDEKFIELSGWAAFENQGAEDCTIQLFLKNGEHLYLSETDPRDRPDVTAAYKGKFNLNNSGFAVKLLKTSLPKGKYQLGFLIKDRRNKKEQIKFIGKEIEI